MTPAQCIRSARYSLGWTQTHAAVCAGIHPAYYSALERGVSSPTVRTMERLAAGFGMVFTYQFTKSDRQEVRDYA